MRGKNFKKSRSQGKKDSNAATQGEIRVTGSACCRGQFGKRSSFISEKIEVSIYDKTLGANKQALLYRTKESTHVWTKCVSCSVEVSVTDWAVHVVDHTLSYYFLKRDERYFLCEDYKTSL